MAYAFAILSIGLTADWRLRHEDNGAMHTTLALSHLHRGLAETRAHDLFVNKHTGERTPYGHHPPATALTLAAAFALTGTDTPAVARLTVIAFHIGSVLLLTAILALLLDDRRGLIGGFVMATLPMSGYFGRMVNYEPLCLFGIMLQLFGFVRFKRSGRPWELAWVVLGILWGGLVDWPSFFFAGALGFVEAVDLVRRRSTRVTLLLVLVSSSTAVFTFDLWHLWYAGGGAMQALGGVIASNQPLWQADLTFGRFIAGQTDTFRRYFTEVGLISILLVVFGLARPGTSLSRRLFDEPSAPVLRRVLVAGGGAALAYILAAPTWAMMHQYWQFYFLPSVVISIVLVWGALEHAVHERPTRLLRTLQAVVVLDVLIASGYWLEFRHTRPEAYAIEATAKFRSTYLAPRSIP